VRDIRRPESAEPLVERLTNPRISETGAPVFPTIMDLLIFAAGVGLTVKRRIAVPSTGKAVPYRIFENNQKDGYIFLVALAEKENAAILAVENDDEIIKIFEEYAAGGLEQTATWLNENPTDISGVQSLIAKIQAQIPVTAPPVQNPNPL
jgi:dnd system-associated protein 4